MDTLGNKIKTMRMKRNLSQQELANQLGVSRSAVGNWEQDAREPNLKMLNALADIFNVSFHDLVGGYSNVGNVFTPRLKRIPIYESVGAETGRCADDRVDSFLSTETDANFGVRVDGDSMEPTILKGDIALVSKQNDVDDGQIAVLLLGDDDTAVYKRIVHIPGGIMLISDNTDKYPPRTIHGDESIHILGRVRQVVREL